MENKIKNILKFYVLIQSIPKSSYITTEYLEEKFKTFVSGKKIKCHKLYDEIQESNFTYLEDIVNIITKYVDIEDVHSYEINHGLHASLNLYVESFLTKKINNRYIIIESLLH